MIINPGSFALTTLPTFIVLDGVNGAGKSTLQKKLQQLFESHNRSVHLTREPGATEIGANVRSILLGNKTQPPSPACELLLFGADRAEHVSKVIKPKLESGTSVISDRYYYSTVAFQGYGRGMDLDLINKINSIAIQNCLPNLLIILDLDPIAGLKRKQANTPGQASEHDRFEHEALAFQQRMRQGFLDAAKTVSEPCLIVDALQSADQVFEAVKRVIAPALS